jgi:hypothetical protein
VTLAVADFLQPLASVTVTVYTVLVVTVGVMLAVVAEVLQEYEVAVDETAFKLAC